MIEFQYFDGCPNASATLNNLKELVKLGEVSNDDIKIVEVNDVEAAKELNFQGSPTILVDGIEIYTEKKPNSYAYSCRVYTIDGIQTGILTSEYILAKIKRIRG
ncbi:MAG: hypothetical protein KAQ68_04395 [Clostridiales bacterium]|nr:hypothetical protein [Clostridiales bacterium]